MFRVIDGRSAIIVGPTYKYLPPQGWQFFVCDPGQPPPHMVAACWSEMTVPTSCGVNIADVTTRILPNKAATPTVL
jgi:hypothetical protein